MPPLLSTADLQAQLGARDLRILDATYFLPEHGRDAAAEYAAGHIPGAAFLDLRTLADPSDLAPMMLPSPQAFAERLGALGVGQGDRILLYDDSPLRSAARAWWMLQLFGARDVALLDGGLAKWRAEGRPLDREAHAPRPATFAAEPNDRTRRTLDQVRANLDTAAEQVLDARSPGRFTGDEPDPRPHVGDGHIPGSRNLHYAELFRPDGTWLRGDELRAAFDRAGVDPSRPLVVTCNSGITAAVLAFGAHLLGHEAALYDGSWSEWGADPGTPKAVGAA